MNRYSRAGWLAAASALLLGCASQRGVDAVSPSAPPREALGKANMPGTTAAMPSDLDVALRQAQAQRSAGDLAGALRILSQLVLVVPDDPRVVGEYGKTLTAQGRSDDALAFLERAIALKPDWSLYSAQGIEIGRASCRERV